MASESLLRYPVRVVSENSQTMFRPLSGCLSRLRVNFNKGMTSVIFRRNRAAWAFSRTFSFAALGAVLAAGTSATALASHRDATVQKPLRGLVTAVGNTGLQLQTSTGTVSVTFSKGTTQVVRFVMGSTADVTAGKRVDLHVVRGTRTVDVIHVEQNKPAPSRPVVVHVLPKSSDRTAPRRDVNVVVPQPLSGQVVSLNGGTLTLRFGNGSTGTFTLASNVNVNEALTGSLADLGVGETVQIFFGKSGNVARSIIITNA
jgi:hypothetical protein